MANYNLGIGGVAASVLDCTTPEVKCYGLDEGHHMDANGAVFHYSWCNLMNRLAMKYNKAAADLAVGDFIDIPVPTYSVLESLRTHIEKATDGFRFNVVDSFGRALTGYHTRATYTQVPNTTNYSESVTVVAPADTPNAIGATATRDGWDFTRQSVPLVYDIPGGIRLEITQVPTDKAKLETQDINLFIGIRRTAICHGKKTIDAQTFAP